MGILSALQTTRRAPDVLVHNVPRYQRLVWMKLNVDGDDEICIRADAFAQGVQFSYSRVCRNGRVWLEH